MSHEEFESIAALDALGIANLGELAAMRMHMLACSPCRVARGEFHRATSMFALALAPIPPPPYMRARVTADASPDARALANRWWLATAATLFIGLWGWRELDVRASRTVIDRLQEQNARLSAEIASLASADTRTIALDGQEIAPRASAKVFLEPDRRRAVVFFHDLPANPGDKSYQLWIIRDPKPVSAGVFDVSESGKASIVLENLPLATEIKGLAVTLEPRGGVAQPTNTRFYVASDL
ncbi:MAG TPA: anti-sigma factor [Thermoanaerobaculia bacterium]|nr:anti-sigma factor [Thermoanaerobaculia bacterium]